MNTFVELIVEAFIASLKVTTGATLVATEEAPVVGENAVTVGAVVSAGGPGATVVNGDVAVLIMALPATSRTPLAPPWTTIR
jgi:hypothetical protein